MTMKNGCLVKGAAFFEAIDLAGLRKRVRVNRQDNKRFSTGRERSKGCHVVY
jgi:hypothetical protein